MKKRIAKFEQKLLNSQNLLCKLYTLSCGWWFVWVEQGACFWMFPL